MDWANQVVEGLETFFKDPNTYGTLGVNEENEIVYILQDNFKRPLQWKHKQERLSHIIKRGKIIVLREKSRVVFHIYTVDQNQVSTIFIGLLSMEGGGNFHCEVIVHELIHLTNVNYRPDTINIIYPILMPSILYTVFRKVLALKKSLNLKKLDPKLVKILNGALGTLRRDINRSAGINRDTIKGWGYHLLTDDKDVYEKYKVYATHVIHATLDETYDDPIVF